MGIFMQKMPQASNVELFFFFSFLAAKISDEPAFLLVFVF